MSRKAKITRVMTVVQEVPLEDAGYTNDDGSDMTDEQIVAWESEEGNSTQAMIESLSFSDESQYKLSTSIEFID